MHENRPASLKKFSDRITLPDGKINLLELTLPQLETLLVESLGQPRFRAMQIWQWLWQKMARDFSGMSNVSGKLREELVKIAAIVWPEIVREQKSKDGTIKLLLRFQDGALAETVLIPAENRTGKIRWSQCLSSQIGCPMKCAFCATGQLGFTRNMSMGEILGQVLIGRERLSDYRLDRPVLRNLVFMGMGEPLLNLKALMPALEILGNDKAFNFSPRRITVSTCGIEPGLQTLGESGLAYLAVSLHAPSQQLRSELMPVAASWSLENIIEKLKAYPLKARERITFEYLLLGGINDSLDHAKALVKLISQTKAKINLIVYNPVAGLPFRMPDCARIEAFQKYLCDHHLTAILRKSKGADIAAACGQLAAAH